MIDAPAALVRRLTGSRSPRNGTGRRAVRQTASGVYRILAAVTLLSVAGQFALAGLGVFSRQQHAVSDGYFTPHAVLGIGIAGLTLLLAAAALLSRAGIPVAPIAVVLFVLAGPIEPLLADLGTTSSAWFGALHALTGAAIAALSATLFARSRRA